MRIVIPGGTGQLGTFLTRWFRAAGHEVLVIGRSVQDPDLRWDGRTQGPWARAIDGADVVINLTGRSVNCRYHWPNLNLMMQSRIDSTLAVGHAIAAAERPPKVWLQASTATIYAHTQGPPHTEAEGELGGREPDAPAYWAYSVAIARSWELALASVPTHHTRKVALRTGFTMSPDKGGVFDVLMGLVRMGLGGPFLGGQQYVSWITDVDVARALDFLIAHEALEGPVNLTAPEPLRNRAFMADLRKAAGVSVGLPILPGMARLGAVFLKTDIELMQKSRRVVPQKLLDAGFTFTWASWPETAQDLARRWRERDLLGAA